MWDSCLRLSEAAGLQTEQINLEEREIRVWGKGGKERVLPLSAWTTKQVLLYQLKERGETESESLFVDRHGAPISTHAIQLMLAHI